MMASLRRPVLLVLGILSLLVATAPRPAGQPREVPVKDVLSKADAYLADYKNRLKFLLADERTTQQVSDWMGVVTATRLLQGDLFVTFLPADGAWVAVHDTAAVDGQPVEGHDDIRRLLDDQSVTGVARELVNRNARFNIGSVIRNFNEPTIGLLVLERIKRSSFKFERAKPAPGDDSNIVVLTFKETGRPTMVRSDGRDVYSSGEIAIDSGTGRIQRTLVQLKYTGVAYSHYQATGTTIAAQLTTTYAHESKLDLFLPATFTERYERGTLRNLELVECVSTYTNWRKFVAQSSFRPVSQ